MLTNHTIEEEEESLELPPLPSPQFEHRMMPTMSQDSASTPPFSYTPPPKMCIVVQNAQQQFLKSQQSASSQNSLQSAGTTPTTGKRPPLVHQRTSMSSTRTRGSTERLMAVQESFDSAYELKLYDETMFETTANKGLSSKRAPLLKGESVGEETGSLSSYKSRVPQSLALAIDSSSNPCLFKQQSIGTDLSPVAEQPSPSKAGKLRQLRFDDSISSENTHSVPITPSKRKSLFSIFQEKRSILMEHVKAISPNRQNEPKMPSPQRPDPSSYYISSNPDISKNRSSTTGVPTSISNQKMAMAARGRGRGRAQSGQQMTTTVNANMLMGRMGGGGRTADF